MNRPAPGAEALERSDSPGRLAGLVSSGDFLYFAYGSNMSLRRLRSADRAPSAEPIGRASLAGYRLVFDKLGRDGSGKADCEKTGNAAERVWGGLFRVCGADRAALDRVEGAGRGYEPTSVVVLADSDVPVTAITYLATDKRSGLEPYGWYLRHVIEGAMELSLPPDYVARIRTIEGIVDPDAGRYARESAIHPQA